MGLAWQVPVVVQTPSAVPLVQDDFAVLILHTPRVVLSQNLHVLPHPPSGHFCTCQGTDRKSSLSAEAWNVRNLSSGL